MKNKLYTVLLSFCILQALSCKKDNRPLNLKPQAHNLENGILSLSANGQLIDAIIDTTFNNITVTVASESAEHNVTLNFRLANGVTASINNTVVNSGIVLDLGKVVSFKIKSDDGSRSTSFTLSAQTELGYFGLSGSVVSQNSLDRSYEFYFDQFDGSTFQFINCGPASTTMAIKWADSTFMGRPVDARNLYLANGGWWNTGQIQAYLNINGINSAVDTLDDVVNVVKTNIDHNNLLILNLDMNYIPLNSNFTQHVSKFYPTTPNWGHFILVKGYKQVGSTFYLDVYDPYSGGNKYSSILDLGQLMGKDRYYLSDDIKVATNNWWPYAIAIAPKGKKVNIATIIRANNLKLVPKSFGR